MISNSFISKNKHPSSLSGENLNKFMHTIGTHSYFEDCFQYKNLSENLAFSAKSNTTTATSSPILVKRDFKMLSDKIMKQDTVPHGYIKFRFNEDCNFENCGYRNHQSHFHCCRTDCLYSFCDKNRFIQHSARHERLDKLMGDEFKQYRLNMICGFEHCVFNTKPLNNKSSHFHCIKCDYICTDTNKVVAHRRQHNKMDYISSNPN